MHTSFNLIPIQIEDRVASRRSSRFVYGVALVLAACGITVAMFASHMETRSAALLAQAKESGAPVVALEAEIMQLRAESAAIDMRLEQQQAVGVAIPASGLATAVAESLSNGATLERLELSYEHVQGEQRKLRRASKDAREPRVLRGVVAGIALNDQDIARVVERIGALAPIATVGLESSKSRVFRGKNVREFRLTFTVDLEKPWKWPLVTMTDASNTPATHEVQP